MPYNTNASDFLDYKKQTIRNINKLINEKSLDIVESLNPYDQPYLLQFFEVYKEYGCEPSFFFHGILTTIGALSDGIRLINPITNTDMPINLMTHLIGELGFQKSHLINIIRRALTVLEKLFPAVSIKSKDDFPPGANLENRNYHLLVQTDIELGLTKTLATRGNAFVISDEIDTFNNRFGVYSTTDERSIAGSKRLCQGFDEINTESRATGSTSYTIQHGSISLLGASTGDKL